MRKMRKMILFVAALLLITSAGVGVQAQNTEKKETEKKEMTTADAWRKALPESEQTSEAPIIVMDDSRDNVEARETPAQIETRVLDLERRLMEAFKGRDADTLKYLLADGFIPAGANITEAQSDKTRFIEWATKNSELKSYTIEKTTVRVYPTAAVVTIRYKGQAVVAGSLVDANFVATDVWVKRGKQWQAASHHVSQLSKP